jgi:hypothetical protein
MTVTNGSTSPSTSVAIERQARQMVDESIGRCHRQALWCGEHNSVWPHGQQGGCNDYLTAVEAATALITTFARG